MLGTRQEILSASYYSIARLRIEYTVDSCCIETPLGGISRVFRGCFEHFVNRRCRANSVDDMKDVVRGSNDPPAGRPKVYNFPGEACKGETDLSRAFIMPYKSMHAFNSCEAYRSPLHQFDARALN